MHLGLFRRLLPAIILASFLAAFVGVYLENFWLAGVLGAVCMSLPVYLLARQFSRDLEAVRKRAVKLATGDFRGALPVVGAGRLAELNRAFNEMTEIWRERLLASENQNENGRLIFANMAEGVIAVDNEERILSVNAAAAKFFNFSLNGTIGRALPEVSRQAELLKITGEILAGNDPEEENFSVIVEGKKLDLQVHGAVLRSGKNHQVGALLIIEDRTRLKRLELARRDFVANVSHELRTPLTAIAGYVETLRDGAIEDPSSRQRFIEIIAKQTDRLQEMIEDLLKLSRIERDAQNNTIEKQVWPLKDVLTGAIEICRSKWRKRDLAFRLSCPSDLSLPINPGLIEQAILNLIDNAAKYTPENCGVVSVLVQADQGQVSIRVIDNGCGIAPEHLSRLFERFYRVDGSRGRDQGGSGLGLAIVKHIVDAHGGTVSVASEVGAGATFIVNLPTISHQNLT